MNRLATLLVLMLAVVPAAARDDDETEMARVRRDQSRVGLRLASLREKFERLSERYEQEGRQRNAQLLREAIARFDTDGLEDRARRIQQNLESVNMRAIEQQDELVTSLEAIYSVLRDRRDVDELRTREDLLNQALGELGHMANDQRKLAEQSRAVTDTPSELVDDALSEARRLQDSLRQASAATGEMQRATDALDEVGLAAWLARSQRQLSRADDVTAAEQRELSASLDELLARLEQPLQDAGAAAFTETANAMRAEARRSAAQAARAMAEAARELEAAESEAAGSPSSEASRPAGAADGSQESAAGKPNEADPSRIGESEGRPGEAASTEAGTPAAGTPSAETPSAETPSGGAAPEEPRSAQGSSQQGAESGEPDQGESGADASDGAQGSQGSEASGTAGESTQAGEDSPPGSAGEPSSEGDGEVPKGAPEDGAPEDGAPEDGAPEDGAPEDGAPEDGGRAESAETPADSPREVAQEAMREAANRLEEAHDSLQDAERALAAARNSSRRMALTAARQAGSRSEELKDLAQRLETLEPLAGPELLDRTRELLAQLAQAEEQLESSDPSAASPGLAAAEQSLNDIIKQLQKRGETASSQPSEELDEQQLASMQSEQAELERRLTELMDRLKDLPDQAHQQPGERAGASMQGAQRAMDQGDQREAGVRQEEAAEQLEEMKEKLQGERDRYEELRQEEVLFRLAEELQALQTRQSEVSAETLDVDEQRGDSERLSRAQRRALARLASDQRELAEQAERVRTELEQDEAVVFVFALDQIGDDMGSAAGRLADQETGYLVQSVQRGIQRRLDDLLAVLDAEMERRREAMQDAESQDEQQEGEPPPESRPRLVPPVAELLLIQRMEFMALSRLEEFERLNPEVMESDELGPMERELLEGWALDHIKVTELFQSLTATPEVVDIESVDVQQPAPDGEGDDDTGGEDDR